MDSCSAPLAAKTRVLSPAPVSSVAHPGCTVRSIHSSAGQCRPAQEAPLSWSAGGSARRLAVSDPVIAGS